VPKIIGVRFFNSHPRNITCGKWETPAIDTKFTWFYNSLHAIVGVSTILLGSVTTFNYLA